MNLAILGTGSIGSAYARALAPHFQLAIGNRDPAKAAALAQGLNAKIDGGGIRAAVKLADVVLLALPYPAIASVLADAGDLRGKILIDVSNPVSADFKELTVGLTTSAAEQIQAAAPDAHVVKAFNTIFAQLVPADARKDVQIQALIAGDDEKAKAAVRQIATALGYSPIDAGVLRNSRFLEPIGMMNIQFGFFLGAGPTTAPAWAHAA
jgi:predicted dinucleotide-binding enzyme